MCWVKIKKKKHTRIDHSALSYRQQFLVFAKETFPWYLHTLSDYSPTNSRTRMIYGRLSIHKMFGTNPVVFAWLPVFPCFRVFSIDGFNPLLSLFRVSFQCWKGQDTHSPDLHDGNYAKCKTPSSSWYVLLLQPRTAQILISLRKNPCAHNILSQNTAIIEELTRRNLKQALFIPTRSQSHAILWLTAGTPNSLIRTTELSCYKKLLNWC